MLRVVVAAAVPCGLALGCGDDSGGGSPASGGTGTGGTAQSGTGGEVTGGSGGEVTGSGGETGGTESGGDTSTVTGAWYGAGPDGDQCFVMCANGRMFTGDRPCTEVDASDFDSYLSYTVTGETVDIQPPSGACWINTSPCANQPMSWTVSGNSASVDWCGFTFVLDRTADSSMLCDDSSRQPC